MFTFILKRTISALLTIVLVLLVSLTLFLNMPGDYVSTLMTDSASRAELRHELLLDKPKGEQFLLWTCKIVKLDFGNSYYMGQPVMKVLKGVLKNSWLIYLSTFLISMISGILIGCFSAHKKDSHYDKFLRFFVVLGVSTPVVIVSGIILFLCIFILEVPYTEISKLMTTWIWIIFVCINIPTFAKYSRNIMIDILSQEYIRTARGKGLSEFKIIFKHALRNSISGLIGTMGLAVNTAIFSGCLIEFVLGFDGIGCMTTLSVFTRDYPLMLGCILVLGSAIVGLNLFCDIIIFLVDPNTKVNLEV